MYHALILAFPEKPCEFVTREVSTTTQETSREKDEK
jgi:hypothetical protein